MRQSKPRLPRAGSKGSVQMSFWVYILRCHDGSYYVGHTDNLESRMAKHHAGEIEGFTATRLPVEIVFSEEFTTRDDAFARERQLKGWSRAKKEALIRGNWMEVSRLAQRQGEERPSRASGRAVADSLNEKPPSAHPEPRRRVLS